MGLRAAGPAEYAIKYTGLRFLHKQGAFLADCDQSGRRQEHHYELGKGGFE